MKTRAALVRELGGLRAKVARKNPEFMRLGYRDDGGRFVDGGTLDDRAVPVPLSPKERAAIQALYQGKARANPASSDPQRGAIARVNTLLAAAQQEIGVRLTTTETRAEHPELYALGARVYDHIEAARRGMARTMSKYRGR